MSIKLFILHIFIPFYSGEVTNVFSKSEGSTLKKYGEIKVFEKENCTGKLLFEGRFQDDTCPIDPLCIPMGKEDESNVINKDIYASYKCIDNLEKEMTDFQTKYVEGIEYEDKETCTGERKGVSGYIVNKCFKGTKYSCNPNNEVVVKLYHDSYCKKLRAETVVPNCNDGHKYICKLGTNFNENKE